MSDYLFVYGTLRKNHDGCLHPFLQDQTDDIGIGFMPGKLYEVKNYPGAIASPNGLAFRIEGEVYYMHNTKRLLQTLDEYEECTRRFPVPHEYERSKVAITLEDKRSIIAWTYLYNRAVNNLEPITCGNYCRYLQVKKLISPGKPDAEL